MKLWGIGMIILGGGAVMAALANWDWWFRINSAQGKLVHDVFGRLFARVLNFTVGAGFLLLGIADVMGHWPVSALLNAWFFDDPSYLEELVPSDGAQTVTIPEDSSGLSEYTP